MTQVQVNFRDETRDKPKCANWEGVLDRHVLTMCELEAFVMRPVAVAARSRKSSRVRQGLRGAGPGAGAPMAPAHACQGQGPTGAYMWRTYCILYCVSPWSEVSRPRLAKATENVRTRIPRLGRLIYPASL